MTKGNDVTFHSKFCEITSKNTNNVITKGVRTSNNVYTLKEKNENSYLGKLDENWLWYYILGHLNFHHWFVNHHGYSTRHFVITDLIKLYLNMKFYTTINLLDFKIYRFFVNSICMQIENYVENRERKNKISHTHLTQDILFETLHEKNAARRWGHSALFLWMEYGCEY